MSAQEVEAMIRSLPPAELGRFAEWWEAHHQSLLHPPAGTGTPAVESEAVKAELLRRRQEYTDHPERFLRMNDAAVEQMLSDIENKKP